MTNQPKKQHNTSKLPLSDSSLKLAEIVESKQRLEELKVILVEKANNNSDITTRIVGNWLNDK